MRKAAAISIGLVGFGLASLPTPALAHQDKAQKVITAVLAHPDDELVFAPVLAAEARKGTIVRLIYVTSGNAGPGVSAYAKGEALAEARRGEARCAGEALGVRSVEFLEFDDGSLTQMPRAPGSPAQKLLPALSAAISAAKPGIVITWGPDGGYGHGDHRMVSALVTQILQQQQAPDRPVLYYPALVHAPLPDILKAQGWATTAPDLAPVKYSYAKEDLTAAAAATQCHKTQFDEATRAALVPVFDQAVWKGEISFREAFPLSTRSH